MYLLTIGGQSIIEKPMTMAEIINTFGSIRSLEIAGFILLKVS